MQINTAKNSVDRMPIYFHMLLPRSCASKWYQWLRIWLSRNIHFVSVNVGMSARNRHFQTNYWCITMYCKQRACREACKVKTSWWRHQMGTFSALLALCAGNSPVTSEFPTQRPVTWNFDVFFDLRLNKQSLSKQLWGWWFETPLRSLWQHCDVCGATMEMNAYY